ncbi:MAG: RAD55 family ATPase [Halobacteria archaeon]
MTEYVSTGSEGLDSIMGGGIYRNSTVLINGNPGTGKSILSMQFLHRGVKQGEKGIYMSFEESREDMIDTAESVGLDGWREMYEEGDIRLYDKGSLLEEQMFSKSFSTIFNELDVDEYDRFVMDSLTMFEMFFEGEKKKRTNLLKLMDILKNQGFTSMLTKESRAIFPDRDIGLQEFLTDGSIYMIQKPTSSKSNRYIWVAKMRKQNIDTHVFPMEISEGGIKVHENAADFSYMEGGFEGEGGF